MTENSRGSKMAIWNARSIKNKMIELKGKIEEYDIMGITETWLTNKDNIRINSYNIIRKDRKRGRGGGLCLVIKNNINAKIRDNIKEVKEKMEILAITTNMDDKEIDIILIYRNPNLNMKKREWDIVFGNKRPGIETIVMGDFNANNKEWNCHKNDKEGITLAEIIEEQDMFICNNNTTSRTGSGKHKPSNLDLIISTFEIFQDSYAFEDGETLGSDHQLIELHINREIERNERIRYSTRKYKTDNIKRKDFEIWQRLEEENIKEKIRNTTTTSEKYEILINNITEGIGKISGEEEKNKKKTRKKEEKNNTNNNNNNRINNRGIQRKTQQRQYPWWDRECAESKEGRREAVKSFIKKPNEENWRKLKKKENEMKEIIRERRNKSWEEMATSINHNTKGTDIWGNIKRLQKGFEETNKQNNITTKEERRELEEVEINKLLYREGPEEAIEMEEIGQREATRQEEENRSYNNTEIDLTEDRWNGKISLKEIEGALEKANPKSAPGENGIDYGILKKLTKEYKTILKEILNEIWDKQEIPKTWKKAIVIFLEKPNKKSLRPISLTDCMGKIMERIINERIVEWAESKNILDEGQNGFRKGRSTLDNLAILVSDVRRGFENRRDTLAVFVDVKGAYDNVDHEILIKKLEEKGCPNKITKYVKEWINNRELECIRNYGGSIIGKLKKGLPQGAILSPILYNIYTADITQNIKGEQIRILQYADDIVFYSSSNARGINEERMKETGEKLIQNLNKVKLDIAEEKTKIVNFSQRYNTNRRGKITLEIKNKQILEEESTKFLGITLDRKLRFDEHIEYILQKTKKRLNMLRYIGHIKKGANPETMVILFKTLIRSVIEYGIPVYHTYNHNSIEKIRKIQNSGIRIAMGYRISTPINVMMVEAGTMDIDNRWELMTNRYIAKHRSKTTSGVIEAIRKHTINQGEQIEDNRQSLLEKALNDTENLEEIIEKNFNEDRPRELNDEMDEEETEEEEIWERIMELNLGKIWKEQEENTEGETLIREIKEKMGQENLDSSIEIYTDGSKKTEYKIKWNRYHN